jgi:hypothetical protein
MERYKPSQVTVPFLWDAEQKHLPFTFLLCYLFLFTFNASPYFEAGLLKV